MRSGILLSASVLIAALGVAPAYADAITDPDAVNYQAAAASLPDGIGTALFDAGGLPFLLTSNPTYLQLTSRGKLRGSVNNNDFGDGGAVGFFVSAGLSADSGGGSNDGGGSNAGASGDNAGGDGSGDGIGAAGAGSPNDGGGSPDDGVIAQVPEPASMFLLGPAALLALRRRNRK